VVEPLAAPRRTAVRGLALACHPGPTVAVTALAGLLATAADAPPSVVALVVAAFLPGQLSVGWSNDWVDAARDRLVARTDKPLAAGLVSRTAVGRAAAVAAVVCVPLSLALGVPAGLAHLVAVASAWSYNLWLKRTAWSWAPFALSFGLLPVVVTLALPDAHVAPWWAITAGALLGVGAHLVNVLPDLEDDRATGVRGVVHRLGRRATALAAPAVLVAATAVVAFAPPGVPGWRGWAGLVVAAVAATVAAVTAAAGRRRRIALVATAAVALVDVALMVSAGASL
jgi:4-hydroxybenzoate polyprenyltransferase